MSSLSTWVTRCYACVVLVGEQHEDLEDPERGHQTYAFAEGLEQSDGLGPETQILHLPRFRSQSVVDLEELEVVVDEEEDADLSQRVVW